MEPHHPEMTEPPPAPTDEPMEPEPRRAPTGPQRSYLRLLEDAAAWEEDGRDESHLYRGTRLAEAEGDRWEVWRKDPERYPPPGPTALAFLAAARAHADTRIRRRLVDALAGALALVVVLAGTTGYAFWRLDRDRDERLAADLVEASRDAVLRDGPLAQLLAAAAWRLDPGDLTWTAMTNAVDAPAVGVLTGGHDGSASTAAFSPDGTLAATGASDGSTTLWDTGTWTPLPLPERLEGGVAALEFSPDGTRLAAGATDRSVVLWDLATGASTALTTPNGTSHLAFDLFGGRLAAGGYDGILTVWDPATGAVLDRFDTGQEVLGLAFDRANTDLVVGGHDGVVRAFDTATWTEQLDFTPYPDAGTVEDLARRTFDSDDFFACSWGGCGLYDHTEGGEWRSVQYPGASSPGALTFDGTRVVAPIIGGGVGVWDAATGAVTAVLPYAESVEDIAIGPDGATVLAVADGELQRWDIGRAHPIEPLYGAGPVADLALTDDGLLVTTGTDRSALWDPEDPATPLAEYPGYAGWAVDAHPGDRIVATSSPEEPRIDLWDTDTGAPIRSLTEEDTGQITLLDFSPDGELLAAGLGNADLNLPGPRNPGVTVWDHRTGQVRSRLAWESRVGPLDIEFSPDGTRIATFDAEGRVLLWDAASGEAVARAEGAGAFASGIEYPSTGRGLYAYGDDRIAVWDPEDLGGEPQVMETDYLTGELAFGPEGTVNAAFQAYPETEEDLDSRLALWHPDHEGLAAALPVDQDFVLELAVTADGRTVILLGLQGISLHDVGFLQGDPYALVCDQAGRRLTEREWQAHLPDLEYGSLEICPE